MTWHAIPGERRAWEHRKDGRLLAETIELPEKNGFLSIVYEHDKDKDKPLTKWSMDRDEAMRKAENRIAYRFRQETD